MKDCKHEHFKNDCAVCWVKLSMGMEVKDSPMKDNKDTYDYKVYCRRMAMMISQEKLNDMLRKSMPDRVKD